MVYKFSFNYSLMRGSPLFIKQFTKRAFLSFFVVAFSSVFWVQGAFAQSSSKSGVSAATALARDALPRGSVRDFGPAPAVPEGALSAKIQAALDTVFFDGVAVGWGKKQDEAIALIRESKDPRLAWIVTDLLRFAHDPFIRQEMGNTLATLLNFGDSANIDIWNDSTNRLMAWDIPAPPDYLRYKRNIYGTVLPEWQKLLVEGDIDWRIVSWGGVYIDDRAFDTTDERCNCIPAADNPPVTDAKSAKWLDDDDIVFGIALNGEARAYPRQIMEVREMVNDTLGGRDLGIPYCTLCGAAQAWFTDDVPDGVDRPVLRTSGLLSRSNKVMFDSVSYTHLTLPTKA